MKFVLTALMFWGFGLLGWVAIAEMTGFWTAVIWAVVVMLLVDAFLWLLKFLAQVLALPFSCLTAGIVSYAIEGVFKYISLFIASKVTSMFVVPWLFSAFWWQALIIAGVFGLIAYLMRPKIVYVRSYSSSK